MKVSPEAIFDRVSVTVGKPYFIILVTMAVIVALSLGLVVDAVNIAISIASFVLALMILGKQHRDECRDQLRDKALHVKLDELVHATDKARDDVIHLEEKTEDEIETMKRD